MPIGTELSEREKGQIDAFHVEGRGYKFIAKKLNRSSALI